MIYEEVFSVCVNRRSILYYIYIYNTQLFISFVCGFVLVLHRWCGIRLCRLLYMAYTHMLVFYMCPFVLA